MGESAAAAGIHETTLCRDVEMYQEIKAASIICVMKGK